MTKSYLKVEVAYALPEQQWVIPLVLPIGATVEHAIQQSNILSLCPSMDLKQQKVGIFGRIVSLTTPLQQGDRVEIYRPLPVDPITRRFQRVAVQRGKKH